MIYLNFALDGVREDPPHRRPRVLLRFSQEAAHIQRNDGFQWTEWWPISFGLLAKWLGRPEARKALKEQLAWAAWEQAGPIGSAARRAVFSIVKGD